MSSKGKYFKNYCMFMEVFIWDRNTLVLSFVHPDSYREGLSVLCG